MEIAAHPVPADLSTKQSGNAPLKSWDLIGLSVWFAIIAGLVEAAGLELFQKINWANWGHTAHVSPEIFWIAPIWDVILFAPIGLLLILVGLLVRKLPVIRVSVFLFALLMFYDWLAVPERLVHRSALILALGFATVTLRSFTKHESVVLKFVNKSLPFLVTAVLVLCAGVEAGPWMMEKSAVSKLPPASTGAQNVVVIVVDTLRADHLLAYGYEKPTSPNIAEIAKQGVLFENAISPSSWTLPSHASLLSGRYSYEHGATDVKPGGVAFDERYPSLAEVFARHGYRTGAFSGNYLYFSSNLGFGRGFIHFEDYFHSAFDGFTRTLYGRELARLFFNREKVRKLLIWLGFPSIDELQPSGPSSWMFRKRASEVNREAFHWIDRDPQRPFFVFMNYFDVHRPYTTPPGYPRKFARLSTHDLYLEEFHPSAPGSRSVAYDECVGYADDQIKSFLDELKRRGLYDRTLLVITSDHGDLFGEHGLYAHRNALYRQLIQVPLIFWQPRRIPAGLRIKTPASAASIASTVSDMLGFSDKEKFPITSLVPLWTSRQPINSWPHPLSELAHLPHESTASPSRYGAMTSLVTPQYHYIFHEKLGAELFDWVRDPEEKTSLLKTREGKIAEAALADEIKVTMSAPQ
jgi:arylsulfatase A-like enzyme